MHVRREPERRRGTVHDLRRGNRTMLLWSLYFDGPLTRQELSAATGLSTASVSNVVGDLIRDGVVVEAGALDSDGGRPRVLLRVDSEYGYVVGIDVGETGVRVELFDLTLGKRAEVGYPLDRDHYDVDSVVERILAGLDAVLADPLPVLGVGIGVPGAVQQEPEVLVHGQTVGWDGVPLERLLRTGTDLPLHIDNGAKNMAQAELWFGAGKGAEHAIVVLVGSGVGTGIITDGSAYHGATSGAGEWGHTTIVVGGRACRCGARGCLEAYVGAEAVLDRYREALPTAPGTDDEESALVGLLTAAERPGAAADVLQETATYLGAGLGGLTNLFNPERIILGGWAGLMLGARLMPEIRAAAARHALRHHFAQTSIELCRLGRDAVAFGAATLPIGHFLTDSTRVRPEVVEKGDRPGPSDQPVR